MTLQNSTSELAVLTAGLERLLDVVALDSFVGSAVESSAPAAPKTSLLHIRLSENSPRVPALAQFLWSQAVNYALSRRRRATLQEAIRRAPDGDLSGTASIATAVRDAFIEFHQKYPSRASEVGEVLAYCIAVHHLQAAQLAAKMSLKTAGNMPVHGLDGIHAKVENGHLLIYFLESKLSQTANDGVADYAASVAGFTNNTKQYRREYTIVRDLGNLDALEGQEREVALNYFDVMATPDAVSKRERSVGVILYSDKKLFDSLPPVTDDQPPGFHEAALVRSYGNQLDHHREAAWKHLTKHGADVNKCRVYFVAVPDVDELRELFYAALGYVPKESK